MDNLEKIFVNSPLRRLMERYLEFDTLRKMLESNHLNLRGKIILEAGCGSGYGLKLLHHTFEPKELFGFDILPGEVEIARRRKIPAEISVDSVVHTQFQPCKFDAVFEFTIMHHIPQWRHAMVEIYRILRPNGVFLASDLDKETTDFFEKTTGVKHPKDAQFEWSDFIRGLQHAGFKILEKRLIFGRLGLFLCQKTNNRNQ